MCKVHLVPEVEEERGAVVDLLCMCCDETIPAGATYSYVEGQLDDGSERRFRFLAHHECFESMILDANNEGCFTYTAVEEITMRSWTEIAVRPLVWIAECTVTLLALLLAVVLWAGYGLLRALSRVG